MRSHVHFTVLKKCDSLKKRETQQRKSLKLMNGISGTFSFYPFLRKQHILVKLYEQQIRIFTQTKLILSFSILHLPISLYYINCICKTYAFLIDPHNLHTICKLSFICVYIFLTVFWYVQTRRIFICFSAISSFICCFFFLFHRGKLLPSDIAREMCFMCLFY